MPGQERSVADRLDAMARQASPTPIATVASLRQDEVLPAEEAM
jgi:hypothetical protein